MVVIANPTARRSNDNNPTLISIICDINRWRTQARATQQRDIEQNRAEARDLREKVAQDLLMLSRDLQGKDALQRRVTELQRSLERVPLLEKELQKTQKDLKVRQLRGTGQHAGHTASVSQYQMS
jgi:uncharacterized sporulation protein YeaH/YhbH (DUF444 family)